MTMELSIATHIAHGGHAARQVLWGLPLGVLSPVGWCLGILWLTEPLGAPVAIAISATWTVAWTGSLFWFYLRRAEPKTQ